MVALPDYVERDNLEERLGGVGFKIMQDKYLSRNEVGEITESPQERLYIIARKVAEIEGKYGKSEEEIEKLTRKFYELISGFYFVPGGRIITNTGKDTALFNCYVLPVEDSIEEIFDSVKYAAIIHKQGGGTGYNFSDIRPRGSYVTKSQGMASGPLSFMEQFDKQTEIINSGNRRGANMGILNFYHPDILDFIYAKTFEGRLQNFNISVGTDSEFMTAVKEDRYYDLRWDEKKDSRIVRRKLTEQVLREFMDNINKSKAGAGVKQKPTPHSLEIRDKEIYDRRSGKKIGRINNEGIIELRARDLFDLISEMAWKTGDPGLIFLDYINKDNPLPAIPIKATNPCGEQPLHPNDACNLGSINLERFVVENDGKIEIDYEKLEETVEYAVRFLDNVNDLSKGPIPQIEETVRKNRRIGLGVMGFADMLIQLKVRYDSERGLEVAEEVMGFINRKAKETSVKLAEEKGVFPNFEISKYNNGKLEDRVRNLERTTIAPTGSISMLARVCSGIEPAYAVIYQKNLRGGESLDFFDSKFERIAKERGFYSEELIKKIKANKGSLEGIEEIPKDIRENFRTALVIPLEGHVKMQAAFQKNVDNAISKTINMPESATQEDIKKAYMLAWELGCKGITVYRDKSKEVQVLEVGEERERLSRGEVKKLPDILPAIYIKQPTPWGNLHANISVDPKDEYGEVQVFAQLGKGGDVVNADLEAITRSLSTILRLGGSLKDIIQQLEGIGSQKRIPTKEGGVTSLPDGLAKALIKYKHYREQFGIQSLLLGESHEENPLKKIEITKNRNITNNEEEYAVKCPDCGGKLVGESGCWRCLSCAWSQC